MQKLKKKGLAASAAIGLGCAIVLTALLCLPFAAAICRGILPMSGAFICAATAAGLGVFIATLFIAGLRQRQALPTGDIIGGGFVLLCALFCALGGKGFTFGGWLLWLAGAVLLGGLLGAFMSIGQNKHKKRRF